MEYNTNNQSRFKQADAASSSKASPSSTFKIKRVIENSLTNVIQEVGSKKTGDGRTARVVTVDISAQPTRILRSSLLSPFKRTKHYLISNINDKRNTAECDGLIVVVKEYPGPLKVELNIQYRASCLPKNTEKVAVTLGGESRPEDILKDFLEQWVRDFTYKRERTFITSFSEEREELERDIIDKALENTGLTLEPNIRLRGNERSLDSFKIKRFSFPISLKDYGEEQELTVNLETVKNESLQGINHQTTQGKLEISIREKVYEFFVSHVHLHDFYYQLQATIQDKLLEKVVEPLIAPLGQKIIRFEINNSTQSPFPEQHKVLIEHGILETVGTQVKGKVNINVKMLLKFRPQYVVRYLQNDSPDPVLWSKKRIEEILKRLLFGKEYAALSNISDIEKSFNDSISSSVNEIGFEIDFVQVIAALPEIEGRERFEDYIDVQVRLQGYPLPVTVKNKIQMLLDDPSKYMENKNPPLKTWSEENLQEVFNDVLFEASYLDFILNFSNRNEKTDRTGMESRDSTIEKEIRTKMEERVSKIGFRLKHLVIQPEFEPLKWLETFSVEVSDSFRTKLGNEVHLTVVVYLKLTDLRKVDKYINTHHPDIKPEVERVIREVTNEVMIKITPHHFYMRFSEIPKGEKKESLVKQLTDSISLRLKNEFAADIKSITPQMGKEGNEVILRLNDLISNFGDLDFNVSSLHGGENIRFKGEYTVNAVIDSKEAWENFIKREFHLPDITDRLQRYLVSQMQSLPIESLKYNRIDHQKQLKEEVEKGIREYAASQFGIDIILSEIHRERTELDHMKTALQIEKGETLLELERDKIEDIKQDTRRGREVTEQLHEFDRVRFDAELHRLKAVEAQITVYAQEGVDDEEHLDQLKEERSTIEQKINRMQDDRKEQSLEEGKELLEQNSHVPEVIGLFDTPQISSSKEKDTENLEPNVDEGTSKEADDQAFGRTARMQGDENKEDSFDMDM